jgi:hypothetical protein
MILLGLDILLITYTTSRLPATNENFGLRFPFGIPARRKNGLDTIWNSSAKLQTRKHFENLHSCSERKL